MSRLPQQIPGQGTLAWHESLFFIPGAVISAVGILILFLPPRYWKLFWRSIIYSPLWQSTTYKWLFYGPQIHINEPVFRYIIKEISKDYYEAELTAGIGVWVKNRSKRIHINYSATHIYLRQKVGWEEQSQQFRLQTNKGFPEVMLEPKEEWREMMVVGQKYSGDKNTFPDIKKDYRLGIGGITITLPGAGAKFLRKGIYVVPLSYHGGV